MNKQELQMMVLFMVIWVALNETVHYLSLLAGLLVSVYCIRFTNRLMKLDYAKEFYVRPRVFIGYCGYILKEIYVAGFDMLKRIFSGNVQPVFLEYTSELKGELPNVVLSNSITSTPGTITVHRDSQNYVILSANPNKKEVEEGIQKGMEPRAKEFEREGN